MAFQIVNFTDAGLTTLQQIASSKSLVIDAVIPCSGTVSENDALMQPPEFFETYRNNNVTASVVSAGSDPNGINAARLVISLQATSAQSETIKMLIVVAHSVEGGSTTTANTFIAALDETGLVVAYNPNIPIKLNVALSFAFDRTAAITIGGSEANYLLHDEAARFVSTHSTAGPTVGENQRIRGTKLFYNDASTGTIFDGGNGGKVTFNYDGDGMVEVFQDYDNYGLIFNTISGQRSAAPVYSFKCEEDLMGAFYTDGDDHYYLECPSVRVGELNVNYISAKTEQAIKFSSPIVPTQDGEGLGLPSKRWVLHASTIYADAIKSDISTCSIIPADDEVYSLGDSDNKFESAYINIINSNEIYNTRGGTLSGIYSPNDKVSDMGSVASPYRAGYFNSFHCARISGLDGGTVKLAGSLTPITNSVDIGNGSQKVRSVHAQSLLGESGDINYLSVNAISINNTGRGSQFLPVVPNVATSPKTIAEIPVGAIVKASCKLSAFFNSAAPLTQAWYNKKLELVTPSANATVCHTSPATTGVGVEQLPAGTYNALEEVTTDSVDNYITILLQRIY